MYSGVNPWTRKPLNCWGYFKLFFFTITGIFLTKLILMLIVGLFMWIWACLALCCKKKTKKREPITGCRSIFVSLIYFHVRIILFLAGFYWLSSNRKYCFKINFNLKSMKYE